MDALHLLRVAQGILSSMTERILAPMLTVDLLDRSCAEWTFLKAEGRFPYLTADMVRGLPSLIPGIPEEYTPMTCVGGGMPAGWNCQGFLDCWGGLLHCPGYPYP
jgi:hypothetical protein